MLSEEVSLPAQVLTVLSGGCVSRSLRRMRATITGLMTMTGLTREYSTIIIITESG